MQFDHLDKKFRDAADHHHPHYDEKAWAKMENLLDKHMPVEEKKRRFLFILLLLLAGIGAAGLLVWQPWQSGKNNQAGEKTSAISNQTSQQVVRVSPAEVVTQDKFKGVENIQTAVQTFPDITKASKAVSLPTRNKPAISNHGPGKTVGDVSLVPDQEPAKEKEKIITSTFIPADIPTTQKKPENKPVAEQKISGKSADHTKPSSHNETAVKNNRENQKIKNKKRSIFFVSLGGGPDISFVKINKPGTTKLFGGAGLGYTYRDRLTVRTGFYSGRKIYSAEPEYYNAPAAFYTYYPYLQGVDANCKVYEVPLALGYNFWKNSRRQFFASAGVSSYFMKKETYTYHYKANPTGPTLTKERSINNVNKHYLAGLTLSAGYTHSISKGISFTVEPYTKLPLKGVGYGRVKLNSAGVLFSIGLQPFSHSKK